MMTPQRVMSIPQQPVSLEAKSKFTGFRAIRTTVLDLLGLSSVAHQKVDSQRTKSGTERRCHDAKEDCSIYLDEFQISNLAPGKCNLLHQSRLEDQGSSDVDLVAQHN